MHIANPIYDVVFKYMMEDEKVAKSFLSAIIGENVVELDFASQEHTIHISPEKKIKKKKKKGEDSDLFLTVCRFDFSAKIALPGGNYKTVLIELQKAKLVSDIMRFRRYLGLHYRNENNAYGKGDDRKARQIYCIFLLGYDVDIPGCPVIQVDYTTKDVITDKVLSATNEFIQSLHHRSWIVQIDQLKHHRRNDLEKLLSIFDQDNLTNNKHILNVNDEDFPETYRAIVRRLRMAYESEKIQIEMEMEDDYLKELQDKERVVAQQGKTIKEQGKAIKEQGRAIKEQGKAIKEQGKTIKEKDKALEEQEKVLEGKDKALEEKDKTIEELKKIMAEMQK